MRKVAIITGALGFIGSHTAKAFKQAGYYVVGIDNAKEFKLPEAFYYLDTYLKDDFVNLTAHTAKDLDAEVIVHIAATSLVGPSIANPGLYYDNNVAKTNKMLCDLHNIGWHGKIIFSSSASVYGNNSNKYDQPLLETDEKSPISPYGRSKLICEQVIEDHCKAFGFKGIALRYFNASGCDVDEKLGNAQYDTHLIPRIIESILSHKQFVLNGNDFATPDGTCLRDYLHVNDIANAHLLAVKLADYLNPNTFDVFNLGTGTGYTNMQIIKECERVLEKHLDIVVGPRLIGDPDARVANPNKFTAAADWNPKHSKLDSIILTTHNWMKKFNYN